MTATMTATTIDLGCGHTDPACLSMAGRLKAQLDPKYSRAASLYRLTGNFDDWLDDHRTARKRSGRAYRLGYRFSLINRASYEDDIHAINTSMPERQGRPMGQGYQHRPTFTPLPMECPRHHVYTYGVRYGDTLAAYLWLYRSGDLAMVSSILGHADHLENNVMYLLWFGMVWNQQHLGGTVFYNLHNSGTDGLRFYKERVGLKPGNVKWALS